MNGERQRFNQHAIQPETVAAKKRFGNRDTAQQEPAKSRPQNPNCVPGLGDTYIKQLSEMIEEELSNIAVERNESEQRQPRPRPRGVLFDLD